MTKTVLTIVILVIISGCSNNESVNPNPPTGEVLLAEISGDSVGTSIGSSTRSGSITSQSLDFTDRDNIRITFYYSGTANNSSAPFSIYYTQDTLNLNIFDGKSLNISATEQFKDTTFASPRVKRNLLYRINAFNSFGFTYFKFRDLKIYKK